MIEALPVAGNGREGRCPGEGNGRISVLGVRLAWGKKGVENPYPYRTRKCIPPRKLRRDIQEV